jgi:hypothetical protein
MRSPSPYNELLALLTPRDADMTPRDYIRAPAFSRLLERVGGMRSQPVPLNVQPFTGVQHKLPKHSAAEWRALRVAAKERRRAK